jgi:hypothetical protein
MAPTRLEARVFLKPFPPFKVNNKRDNRNNNKSRMNPQQCDEQLVG